MRKFVAALALATFAVTAAAQVPSGEGRKWAVVDLSANYMREAPDYTTELGDQTLRQVVSPEPYRAWVNELGLAFMTGDEANAYIASPKYICTSDYTHVYSGPSFSSGQVSDLVMGCLLRPVTDSRGKAVKKGKFFFCMLPSGRTGWVPKADVTDFAAWTASRHPDGNSIVETAMRFLGVPYMWGGASVKGVDCSGLTLCAYFIHSSQFVRISSLDPAEPDHYERKPVAIRRILGHTDGNGVTPLSKSPLYFIQSE